MTTPIIALHDVYKRYPGGKYNALDGLSLTIKQGDFFGLLGPNGSGKTTLISILCGLINASRGDISMFGAKVPKYLSKIKPKIGLVPQEIALYPSLSLLENMRFFGRLYHLKRKTLRQRIDDLCEHVGLSAFRKQPIASYSGGMKRRANLITTLLHKPELVFVDEATANVDPQSREMIYDVLRGLHQSGVTIVYTSHYMDEIEALCNNVAIVDRGRLIAEDSTQQLIQKTPNCQDLGEVFLALTGHALRDETPC